MEPISTALMAVQAASSAIKFVKERVNDVESVSQLSDQLSTIFAARQKINEERNKQASVGVDIKLTSSIDAVLAAKDLEFELQQISTLINLRWPKPANQPSTWQEILNHHAEAVKKQKEQIAAQKREAARKAAEFNEALKNAAIVGAVIAITIALFAFLFVAMAEGREEPINL
jgi:DNA-binding transcriptional MerR regulator